VQPEPEDDAMQSIFLHVEQPGRLAMPPPRSSARYVTRGAATAFQSALESAAPEAAGESVTVRRGDTLWSLCRECMARNGRAPSNTEVAAAVRRVADANGLRNPDLIHAGQRLDMSAVAGPKAAPALPAPSTPVSAPPAATAATPPAGILPRSTASYRVAPSNQGGPEAAARAALDELDQAASAPRGKRHADEVASILDRLLSRVGLEKRAHAPESPWQPLLDADDAWLSSEFGMRTDPFSGRREHHDGVDIAAVTGTHIYPFKAGRVTQSGWDGGYGQVVVVQHADGTETRYGHASERLVEVGDTVVPNEPIAKVGSTGRSTGPHLHFELRVDGEPVDPVPHLTRGHGGTTLARR
jgi:murein DD-endopeptidase MepM/ murein hydrolase activator NlpD